MPNTPVWAGIYMIPLTVGFLIAGPLSGMLSDRYGARAFATIGSLFSAFLGYNPIKQLLGPTGALQKLPARQAAYITGQSFFPRLIEQPFASGLHLAFTFAAVATGIGVVASAVRGRLPGRPRGPHRARQGCFGRPG